MEGCLGGGGFEEGCFGAGFVCRALAEGAWVPPRAGDDDFELGILKPLSLSVGSRSGMGAAATPSTAAGVKDQSASGKRTREISVLTTDCQREIGKSDRLHGSFKV